MVVIIARQECGNDVTELNPYPKYREVNRQCLKETNEEIVLSWDCGENVPPHISDRNVNCTSLFEGHMY